MLVNVLLLLLPAIVYGHISVRVKAGKERGLVTVAYSGSIVEIIPDKERETWQINDEKLMSATELFSGGYPSDVFVKSPTPWNDLYGSFGWNQVQRTLIPTSATIHDVFSHPIVVATQELVNNGTAKATFNINLQTEISDVVSNTWAEIKEDNWNLTIGQKNTYKIEIDFGEAGKTSSFSYKSTFAKEEMKPQGVDIGLTYGMPIELEPGQTVIATLTATRRYIEVQVDYTASLSGNVACNYDETFKGHHFWRYDINHCLEAAKLPMSKETYETIKIAFYTDAKVTVFDKASQALIAEEIVPVLRN